MAVARPAGASALAVCVSTHLPEAGNPAVDSGSNPEGRVWEQRGTGFPCVLGPARDIGATELLANGIFRSRFESE